MGLPKIPEPAGVAGSKLRAAAASDESVFTLSALAQYLADIGHQQEAEQVFERALNSENDAKYPSDDARALAMGWYAAMVEGNGISGAAKAERLYMTALSINAKDPLAMGNYAVFLHRIKRDHAAAARAYQKAVQAHPSHASILCKYGGFVKHVENNYGKARVLFEAAIKANPAHAESLGNLAVLLHGQSSEQGEASLDRIEDLYKRAVHADPANANNFSNYGLFLAERRKDMTGAEALYKRAADIDPQHANSIYNYAVLLDSGLQQRKRAEVMYRRCLDVNPEHTYALYNLAVLKEETAHGGDFSDAKQLFERAVRSNPSDALTRADYGRFLGQVVGDLDGAVENLRAAMQCDETCVEAQYNLAKILLDRRRWQEQGRRDKHTRRAVGGIRDEGAREAKSLLQKVLQLDAGHSGANLCLARLLADEQDLPGALQCFEAALNAKHPSDIESMVELATLLGTKSGSADAKHRADQIHRRATALARTEGKVPAVPNRGPFATFR